MDLTPYQLGPDDPALSALLVLMHDCFGYMEGRIAPPSSLGRVTEASLRDTAAQAEIWCIGAPPLACMILTAKPGRLYLGKVCVAPTHQRLGLARHLINHADARARALRLPMLELQTRVELEDNHATFHALGFTEYARTAHAGFDRPTSITMRKPVS
ncbi:GNAT family N-acetyltransferase [Sulfitobacter sp.]|jgi:GNAT superfamily N-acetyltransferase|uniref:GNAT family N-acetyltransferase n=1 Tax=Sulfitobacter sp. TaxID=1903071 RepID=UPI003F6BD410|tara:strand:+ start:370 stop:840 length:471 start_codon:yes stop_codon:yes gene_type:complete